MDTRFVQFEKDLPLVSREFHWLDVHEKPPIQQVAKWDRLLGAMTADADADWRFHTVPLYSVYDSAATVPAEPKSSLLGNEAKSLSRFGIFGFGGIAALDN